METQIKKTGLLQNLSLNSVLAGITTLLVLMVIFQSFQIQQLKGYMNGFAVGSNLSAKPVVSAVKSEAPISVSPAKSSLPGQVGGC